jgi:hypothetical protein
MIAKRNREVISDASLTCLEPAAQAERGLECNTLPNSHPKHRLSPLRLCEMQRTSAAAPMRCGVPIQRSDPDQRSAVRQEVVAE